jgi:lysophospholipase L1-like esterase
MAGTVLAVLVALGTLAATLAGAGPVDALAARQPPAAGPQRLGPEAWTLPVLPDLRPTAIVAMGDSYLSGEAAGSYEPGTDTPGNFCHRSTRSAIHATDVPGVDHRVNLACSGAFAGDLRSGGTGHEGEAPQATRLRAVAEADRVVAVVVSIGGNDLSFNDMIRQCLAAFLPFVAACRSGLEPGLPARLAAAAPKVDAALGDIRAVMAEAGYAPDDYLLVLQSYPSPVTEDIRTPWLRLPMGCPFTIGDMRFARTVLAPAIAEAWAEVAAARGASFLDLSRAFEGHEVCAAAATPATEWAQGISIDLGQLLNGVGANVVQQSFHPNTAGHAQIGRCITAIVTTPSPRATCLPGAGGDLGLAG